MLLPALGCLGIAVAIRAVYTGVSRGLAIGAASLMPFIAARWVLGHAESGYEEDSLGVLAISFVGWLAFPAVVVLVLAIGYLRRSRGIATSLVAGVAVVLCVWSAWLVRPIAPNGSDHPESLRAGFDSLRADVERYIDAVAPDRVKLDASLSTTSCKDVFGRTRGAADSGMQFTVDGGLSDVELDRLADQLRSDGWQVETGTSGTATRSPYVGAQRDGYYFGARREANGLGHGQAGTPCLRE
ncbi:MAG: hypothetical protein ACR2LQ_01605 [Acidimicrobiales bacterium]